MAEYEASHIQITKRAELAEEKLASAEKELRSIARKIGKERELSRTSAAFAWENTWHNRSDIEEYKDRILRCRPVLQAAMCVEGNPQLNEMAHVLSDVFGAFTEEEEACIMNRYVCIIIIFMYEFVMLLRTYCVLWAVIAAMEYRANIMMVLFVFVYILFYHHHLLFNLFLLFTLLI